MGNCDLVLRVVEHMRLGQQDLTSGGLSVMEFDFKMIVNRVNPLHPASLLLRPRMVPDRQLLLLDNPGPHLLDKPVSQLNRVHRVGLADLLLADPDDLILDLVGEWLLPLIDEWVVDQLIHGDSLAWGLCEHST
jgi:hypothetical protein